MARKQLSAARMAGASEVVLYSTTASISGGANETTTGFDACPPTAVLSVRELTPGTSSSRTIKDRCATARLTGDATPFTNNEICSGAAPKLVPFRVTVAPLVGIALGDTTEMDGARYDSTSDD
jgi:hypothetical protein